MKKVKIMPLGDSITHGFVTDTGGYRAELCRLLEINGKKDFVSFCGSQTDGTKCYDTHHEGHPGWATTTILPGDNLLEGTYRDGIYHHLKQWLLEKPDVILLQIGTNDILSLYELTLLQNRLRLIIEQIFSQCPNVILFTATIPYLDATVSKFIPEGALEPDTADRLVKQYNQEIKELVKEFQGKGQNIVLSDINSILDKSDLIDGVHPNNTGYRKMGEYWFHLLHKHHIF